MATNQILIEKIFDNEINTDFEQHILAAQTIIAGLKLSTALDKNGDLYHSSATLDVVETWLAAHFAAVEDPRTVNESASGGSAGFETAQVTMYLSSTRYGQAAIALDFSGLLNEYNDDLINGKVKKSLATLTNLGWNEESDTENLVD
jgi:hypothetical protein